MFHRIPHSGNPSSVLDSDWNVQIDAHVAPIPDTVSRISAFTSGSPLLFLNHS